MPSAGSMQYYAAYCYGMHQHKFNVHMPCRGILLHGLPGTGKTHAVRALAGECARRSPQPVTLFARKGADCLGKYAGDAERILRIMFEEVGAPQLWDVQAVHAFLYVQSSATQQLAVQGSGRGRIVSTWCSVMGLGSHVLHALGATK